jgi:hypothetical protein
MVSMLTMGVAGEYNQQFGVFNGTQHFRGRVCGCCTNKLDIQNSISKAFFDKILLKMQSASFVSNLVSKGSLVMGRIRVDVQDFTEFCRDF